jgi:hypothetical protein
MKITPLKSYAPPAYPTYGESKQDPRLLANLPRRWRKNPSLAPLLGTGILFHIAGSECRADEAEKDVANVKTVLPAEHEKDDALAIENARPLPAVTRVAPLLEEALAKDGRGSFGCVAISSPVFLSENEALDLIEDELGKVGIVLHDMVTVDGLEIPSGEKDDDWGMGRNNNPKEGRKLKKLAPGSYTFDLGTEDGSVVVKFLQHKDFNQWKADRFSGSSVDSYDLAWLATQMRETFAKRAEGKPVVIGLFFDPVEDSLGWGNHDGLDFSGLEDGQERYVSEQITAQTAIKDTRERAREKFRKQVAHFVEYLGREGVLKEKDGEE